MTEFNLSRIVLICACVLLALAFIALGLGLAATSLEAAFGALIVFIAHSFLN